MKVRMLATSAGPDGIRHIGGEYDVSPEEGKDLCSGGYAVPVGELPVERAEKRAPRRRARTAADD